MFDYPYTSTTFLLHCFLRDAEALWNAALFLRVQPRLSRSQRLFGMSGPMVPGVRHLPEMLVRQLKQTDPRTKALFLIEACQ
mgnify:FL=1|jgi:hypothetical protein|tara:strand:- start:123 stop:368 length:246 start_codon:yes stop_codon:yes gene_type:complete